MSMHIEGPWLSAIGKKPGKKKWASAEQKRNAQQLATEWERNKKKWQNMSPKFATTATAPKSVVRVQPVAPAKPKSLNTWVVGPVSTKPNPVYTGDNVIGISQMAKSNAIPIFTADHIVDIARMRR